MTTQKEKINRIMTRWEKGEVTKDEMQFMFRQAFRYIELQEKGRPSGLDQLIRQNDRLLRQQDQINKLVRDVDLGLVGDISVAYVIYRLQNILNGVEDHGQTHSH